MEGREDHHEQKDIPAAWDWTTGLITPPHIEKQQVTLQDMQRLRSSRAAQSAIDSSLSPLLLQEGESGHASDPPAIGKINSLHEDECKLSAGLLEQSVDDIGEDTKHRLTSSSAAASSDDIALLIQPASVTCQVNGCKSDLSGCKDYHKRHKVCEMHAKATTVMLGDSTQRFCQQCSRFHQLAEFDEGKRSCRRRLEGHNQRRRKLQNPDSGGNPVQKMKASDYSTRKGSQTLPSSSMSSISAQPVDQSTIGSSLRSPSQQLPTPSQISLLHQLGLLNSISDSENHHRMLAMQNALLDSGGRGAAVHTSGTGSVSISSNNAGLGLVDVQKLSSDNLIQSMLNDSSSAPVTLLQLIVQQQQQQQQQIQLQLQQHQQLQLQQQLQQPQGQEWVSRGRLSLPNLHSQDSLQDLVGSAALASTTNQLQQLLELSGSQYLDAEGGLSSIMEGSLGMGMGLSMDSHAGLLDLVHSPHPLQLGNVTVAGDGQSGGSNVFSNVNVDANDGGLLAMFAPTRGCNDDELIGSNSNVSDKND